MAVCKTVPSNITHTLTEYEVKQLNQYGKKTNLLFEMYNKYGLLKEKPHKPYIDGYEE